MNKIYLDANGGTKPYPEVIDIIIDVLTNHWGNPGAVYELGDNARNIINIATQIVSGDINCNKNEIVWTSSATESNVMAIVGVLNAHPHMQFLTTKLEHSSIIETVKHLDGHPAFFLKNDNKGFVDLNCLDQKLHDVSRCCGNNFLVSVSGANSEIGTKQNIKEISKIVHNYGGIFHTDCSQLFTEQPINVKDNNIDLMTLSGQKIHAGHGCGVLYIKNGVKIQPIIYGKQQNELRGSTLPTHLIAAFGKALEITRKNNPYNKISLLRNRLLNKLMTVRGVRLNGPEINEGRLYNNINLTIDGVNSDSLVTRCSLLGVYLNKGAVCQSYDAKPSETLKAIGLSDVDAFNTIRISLDQFNTEAEIDIATDVIIKMIEQIRQTNN